MEELIPTEYFLSQNHPDPFNKKTIIKYCLPEEVKVKLEVFDYENKKVQTLIDEVKEPGTYQVEFKPKGINEGIYLYQLTAGCHSITKRMLLTK